MSGILDKNGKPVRRQVGFERDRFVVDDSTTGAGNGGMVNSSEPEWVGRGDTWHQSPYADVIVRKVRTK